MPDRASPSDVLIRRLLNSTELREKDLKPFRTLPFRIREVARNETICREGDRVDHCILILDGFLTRFLNTRDGRRQILSVFVPGDIPDLQSLHLPTMDHNLGSIMPATIAMMPHKELAALCDSNPQIASALWRESLIEASIMRRWIRILGRQTARERVAHLLCEIYVRMDAVALARKPIRLMTQQDMGDALGLSFVQINRTLRALRLEGLITVDGRHVTIDDWPGLRDVADFDPLYLHLDPGSRR